MEEGVKRWMVNISKWNPQPTHFSFALSLLPSQQHSSITRFFKFEDRKRALISQMLQYALLCDLIKINIPFIIKRTSQNKPYLDLMDYDKLGLAIFPNFNFNVSHHGDYVAIASEPLCLVGIDIVSFDIPQGGETVAEFIRCFSSYFSTLEWDNIVNAGTSNDVLIEFYKYWSLKEAYVKAMGSGLIEGLNKVEFSHSNWTNISATMDGKVMALWRFWLIELGERHCIPLWNQKASNRADGVILWDYHVICIQINKGDSPPLVWDLDSSLPFPSPLASYVSETIRPSFQLFSDYNRLFRIVHAPVFLRCFASDRRHMKGSDGHWMEEPPPHEPIVAEDGTVHNLNEYFNISNSETIADIKTTSIKDAVFSQKHGVVIKENQLEELFSHISLQQPHESN